MEPERTPNGPRKDFEWIPNGDFPSALHLTREYFSHSQMTCIEEASNTIFSEGRKIGNLKTGNLKINVDI